MDIFSILIFFIYIILVLMVLIYISPVLSIVVLFILPVLSVLLLPAQTIGFLSIREFSFLEGTLLIQNIHVMLLIWTLLIGVVAYTEFISWYLARDERPQSRGAEPQFSEIKKADAEPVPSGVAKKPFQKKIEDLLLKLGKIMSGGK